MDVGQAKVETLVPIGQPFVVDAQQVKDRACLLAICIRVLSASLYKTVCRSPGGRVSCPGVALLLSYWGFPLGGRKAEKQELTHRT